MVAYAAAGTMSEKVRMQINQALSRAADRFNAGAYKDALDEFEVPYHLAPRGERPLYLGLIRVSAGLYHFERGQPVSALKLYRSGRDLLARVAPAVSDLQLQALVGELDAVYAPLLAAAGDEAKALRPSARPQLQRVDRDGSDHV